MKDRTFQEHLKNFFKKLPYEFEEVIDEDLYKSIYEHVGDESVKKIFVIFHSELNHFFTFMNHKSERGGHYNAHESRMFLLLIDYLLKVAKLYKTKGKISLNGYYKEKIRYAKSFLCESGGSLIPADYEPIKIEDVNPIFTYTPSNLTVEMQNVDKITRDFAREQLDKITEKIGKADYSGAITNCRSLLEDVCKDVYKQASGKELSAKGNLIGSWNSISKVLNLQPGQKMPDFLKQILSGLSTAVSGISAIRNKMSDSHSQTYKPDRHHAILARNSTLTIVEFLFDTLEYQKQKGMNNDATSSKN